MNYPGFLLSIVSFNFRLNIYSVLCSLSYIFIFAIQLSKLRIIFLSKFNEFHIKSLRILSQNSLENAKIRKYEHFLAKIKYANVNRLSYLIIILYDRLRTLDTRFIVNFLFYRTHSTAAFYRQILTFGKFQKRMKYRLQIMKFEYLERLCFKRLNFDPIKHCLHSLVPVFFKSVSLLLCFVLLENSMVFMSNYKHPQKHRNQKAFWKNVSKMR